MVIHDYKVQKMAYQVVKDLKDCTRMCLKDLVVYIYIYILRVDASSTK